MADDEKMEYEAEPIESMFVSFDEANKLFYIEINNEYGFTIAPNQFLEFVNKSIIVINEVIRENFSESIKSFMSSHHHKAAKGIEEGDDVKAIEEIERMLSQKKDEDDGAIAA